MIIALAPPSTRGGGDAANSRVSLHPSLLARHLLRREPGLGAPLIPSHILVDAACEGVAPSAAVKDASKRTRGGDTELTPGESTAAAQLVSIFALGPTGVSGLWSLLRPPVRRLVARLVCAVADERHPDTTSRASSSSSGKAETTATATVRLLDEAAPNWRSTAAAVAVASSSSAVADTSEGVLHPLRQTAWMAACCRVLLCAEMLQDDSLACRRRLQQRFRLQREAAEACTGLGAAVDEAIKVIALDRESMVALPIEDDKSLCKAFQVALSWVTTTKQADMIVSDLEIAMKQIRSTAADTKRPCLNLHQKVKTLLSDAGNSSGSVTADTVDITEQREELLLVGKGAKILELCSGKHRAAPRALPAVATAWEAVGRALQSVSSQVVASCMEGAAGAATSSQDWDETVELPQLQDTLASVAADISTATDQHVSKRARDVVLATSCAEELARIEEASTIANARTAIIASAKAVETFLWQSQ